MAGSIGPIVPGAIPVQASERPTGSSAASAVSEELLIAQIVKEGVKAAENGVRKQDAGKKVLKAEHIEKELEANLKAAASASSGLFGKIFGWIAQVVALVVSVVLTAVTLGAASPLLAAMLVTSVALAAYSMAASVVKEASGGTVNIGVSDIAGKMWYGIFKAFGASEEVAKQAEKIGGIVTELVLGVALGGAAGAAASSAKAVSSATRLAQNLEKLADLAEKVPQLKTVAESLRMFARSKDKLDAISKLSLQVQKAGFLTDVGMGVSSAAVNIWVGHDKYQAEKSRALLSRLSAMMTFLESLLTQKKDEYQKAVDESQKVTKSVSDMATQTGRTNQNLMAAFGSGSSSSFGTGFA